ncbi:MAG: hypothetical protein ACK55I_45030, partial [bacterium]
YRTGAGLRGTRDPHTHLPGRQARPVHRTRPRPCRNRGRRSAGGRRRRTARARRLADRPRAARPPAAAARTQRPQG